MSKSGSYWKVRTARREAMRVRQPHAEVVVSWGEPKPRPTVDELRSNIRQYRADRATDPNRVIDKTHARSR